jgi:large conductance mechanosensitive channel
MLKEFREFAMKGNVVDMAVGIIIGAAFTAIVTSLVQDVIMPPVGFAMGGVDFTNMYVLLKPGEAAGPPYESLEAAQAAGAVTVNYGVFMNAVIQFLIVAFVTFMLVRAVNRLRRQEVVVEAESRLCPFCRQPIHLEATRCPACTSNLSP